MNVMKAKSPLIPLQQRFLEEYAVDFNAAAAAGPAGYSMVRARRVGDRDLPTSHAPCSKRWVGGGVGFGGSTGGCGSGWNCCAWVSSERS